MCQAENPKEFSMRQKKDKDNFYNPIAVSLWLNVSTWLKSVCAPFQQVWIHQCMETIPVRMTNFKLSSTFSMSHWDLFKISRVIHWYIFLEHSVGFKWIISKILSSFVIRGWATYFLAKIKRFRYLLYEQKMTYFRFKWNLAPSKGSGNGSLLTYTLELEPSIYSLNPPDTCGTCASVSVKFRSSFFFSLLKLETTKKFQTLMNYRNANSSRIANDPSAPSLTWNMRQIQLDK